MKAGEWELEVTAMRTQNAGGVAALKQQLTGDAAFAMEMLDVWLGDETVVEVRVKRAGLSDD